MLRFARLGFAVGSLGFILALEACGDTFQGDGDGGSGGSGGSGTGSSSGSGGSDGAECETVEDCVAAVDFSDPCFSPSCSSPFGAPRAEVDSEVCLVPWDDRNEPVPEQCTPSEELDCPALCAVPPTCVFPRCDAGTCRVDVGFDELECRDLGTGGTGGGTGGNLGTGGSNASTCDDLLQELRQAIEAARSCLTNGIIPECNGTEKVKTECGCELAANENKPEEIDAAEEALEAYLEGCEARDDCTLVDCAPAEGTAVCNALDVGSELGRCSYDLEVMPL